MAAPRTYLIHNSAMVTTAAPVKQPTGTAIRTMMQLAPSASVGFMKIHEWGFSLDSYATGGEVELLDAGTVFATMSTAYAVGDIQPHSDPKALANTSGGSGLPLNLGTALSGFATAAVTEGAITAAAMKDLQLDPQGPYVKQWPLDLEPQIPGGNGLRIRMTFGTSVNAYCYVIASFGY
jgi:hypothetical protein